jgi:hypothetical protein
LLPHFLFFFSPSLAVRGKITWLRLIPPSLSDPQSILIEE